MEKPRRKRETPEEKLIRLTQIEEELWAQGKTIAGIDEVGRGPLAGPVCAAAVILPMGLQAVFSVILNLGVVLFSAQMPLMVGNVQTVLNLAMIGLVLSVFREDSIVRETAPKQMPRRERRRLRLRVVCEWV